MKTRVKMGQKPGDVPKHVKIAMLEGKFEEDPTGRKPVGKRSKSFKRMIRMKEKAVLKERAKKEISSES